MVLPRYGILEAIACRENTLMIANKNTVWMPVDELSEWDANPNHGDLGSIITSILRFGFLDELDVYETTVMCGNHRLKAVHELRRMYRIGEQQEAIDQALGRSTRLRVVGEVWELALNDISHLPTWEEAMAYALAHNRTNRLGIDDSAKLLSVLEIVRNHDPTLIPPSGYDYDDLNDLEFQVKGSSLDDLEQKYGDVEDSAFWPVIRVQVPPDVHTAFKAILTRYDGETSDDQFIAWVRDAVVLSPV